MFDIGSTTWPGLGKVIEETSELQQVLAKIIATGGSYDYYDGTLLDVSLHDELADTLAAIWFLIDINNLDSQLINERGHRKLQGFKKWHREQHAINDRVREELTP